MAFTAWPPPTAAAAVEAEAWHVEYRADAEWVSWRHYRREEKARLIARGMECKEGIESRVTHVTLVPPDADLVT